MIYLILDEVDSTNNYVAAHAGELADMTMVVAASQTSGRGQRGNVWESEPGANLTFTLYHEPRGLEPRRQFELSMSAALAMARYLQGFDWGAGACIKWPNDIYVGNRKIAGILIENSVTTASIEHTRIGIGLNVNQTEFRGDAPNPVSMAMLAGRRFDLDNVRRGVADMLERHLAALDAENAGASLVSQFESLLWRHDGKPHAFREPASGITYQGCIIGVDATGPISIQNVSTLERKEYRFKEIEFVL